MNKVSTDIQRVVHGLILGAGVLGAVGAAAPVVAADDVEEVVVTGSRVRGAAPVGSAVTTVGREEIISAPAVSLDRIIKDIPQNFDLGVSENSRGQSGGAGNIVYGNTVNLRGIGPYATLVIIDGHRAVNNSRSIDPSMLPTLAVERVEVVADGASAIYGSDAVAGVVNIIPRRALDGVEAFGRYGVAEGGYSESVVGAAWGKVFSRGQAMLAYEHAHKTNLSGDDRGFFVNDQRNFGGRDYRVTRCNPGTLKIGTTTYAIPAGGLTAANVAGLVAGTTNLCNELPGQDLSPEQTYNSLAGTATFELSDRVSVFADGFYSERDFVRYPGYAVATVTVPQTNAWFVRPAGFTGTSYTVDYSFINDLPRNKSFGMAQNWEISPGFRVKLPAKWQFEAVMTYGRNHDDSTSLNGTNNTALNAALASSDPAKAFDPYGLNRTAQSVRDGIANQIFLAPTLNKFLGYEARLNGSIYSLPGGDVGLAAGYEGQKQDVDLGSARGNPGTVLAYRSFSRKVDSGYAELMIPIVGAANAMPGVKRLALDAAVRYDKYDDVGSTTNQKFGASWAPTDTLGLRASYGTSFRAPLISQIYGSSNNLFVQNYVNPAGGPTLTGVALSGPNLNLKPETARTWSIGADWDPTPELKLGLTYWDVKYENQVEGQLSNLSILSREAEFAGTGLILRGTEARDRVLGFLAQGVTLASGSFPGGSANNVTLFVDGRNSNLGKSVTRGFDLQGRYRVDTQSSGRVTLNFNGTYLTTYDVAITANAPMLDRLNLIYNPLRLKTRAGVTWDYGSLSTTASLTYVGAYTNNTSTAFTQSVSAYSPVDLMLQWKLGSGRAMLGNLVLGLEARNVFDEKPPYVNVAPTANGSGGYDASVANPVGRLLAISLRSKW